MKTLKYKVITSDKQYDEYCDVLENLVFAEGKRTREENDEIDLLTLLIEKWDEQHSIWRQLDPVEMLRSLMDDHKMKAKDLAKLLDVHKSYVSAILNYKKGLSKNVIRKLANHFKLRQDAFNRPYKLKSAGKSKTKQRKTKTAA